MACKHKDLGLSPALTLRLDANAGAQVLKTGILGFARCLAHLDELANSKPSDPVAKYKERALEEETRHLPSASTFTDTHVHV